MRTALSDAGFALNNTVQQIITHRCATDDLLIDLDGFVACMLRLETLFKIFQMMEKDKSDVINLTLPEVNIMYCI
ncbi:hypothetical protein NDU88_010512 [Pleurodeles waltl]|uniref:Uncharacterized protein n=1 Tax=Pleurodeles waltl TaxID=8319 RepID=A0AAV7S3I6_PLEWA|nr:hypothetical protein NDU88_010512 [Pleurodeles waltl]